MTTPIKQGINIAQANERFTSSKKSRLPIPVKACESLKKGVKRHLSPSVGDRDAKRSVLAAQMGRDVRQGQPPGASHTGGKQRQPSGGRKVLSELPGDQRKVHKARRALQVNNKPQRHVRGKNVKSEVKENSENTPEDDNDFGFEKDDQALQSILNDTGIQALPGGASKPSMAPGRTSTAPSRSSTLAKCVGTPGRVRHTVTGEPGKTPTRHAVGMRESIGIRTFRQLCDDFMSKQTKSKRLRTETRKTTREAGFQFDPKLTPSRVSFTAQRAVPSFTSGMKDTGATTAKVDQLPGREPVGAVFGRASLPASRRLTSGGPNPFTATPRLSMYAQTPSRVKKTEASTLDVVKEMAGQDLSQVEPASATVSHRLTSAALNQCPAAPRLSLYQTPSRVKKNESVAMDVVQDFSKQDGQQADQPAGRESIGVFGRASLPAARRLTSGAPNPFNATPRLSMYAQTPSRVKKTEGPTKDLIKETASTIQPPARVLKTVPGVSQATNSPCQPSRQSVLVASPAVHTPRRQPVHSSSVTPVTPQRVTRSVTTHTNMTPMRVPVQDVPSAEISTHNPVAMSHKTATSESMVGNHGDESKTETSPGNLNTVSSSSNIRQEMIEQTSSPMLSRRFSDIRGQQIIMTPQGHGRPVRLGRGQGHFTPQGRLRTTDIRLMSSPAVRLQMTDYSSPVGTGCLRRPSTPRAQCQQRSDRGQGQATPQGGAQTMDLRLMWRTKKTPNKTPVKKEILSPAPVEGILKSPQICTTPLGQSETAAKEKKKITWADTLESYRHTNTGQIPAKSSEDESFDIVCKNLQFSSADGQECVEDALGTESCIDDVIGCGKQGQCDESSVTVTGELKLWPQQQASNPISHDAMQDEPSREGSVSSQSSGPHTPNNASSAISDGTATIHTDVVTYQSSSMGIKVGGSIGGLPEKVPMAPCIVTKAVTESQHEMTRSRLSGQDGVTMEQIGSSQVSVGPSTLCDNLVQGLMSGSVSNRMYGKLGPENVNIVSDSKLLQDSDNVNRNNELVGELSQNVTVGMGQGVSSLSALLVPNVSGDDNRELMDKFVETRLISGTQGLLSNQLNDVDVNSNFLLSGHQQENVQLQVKNANICDDKPTSPSYSLRKNDNESSFTTVRNTSKLEQSTSKREHTIKTPPPNKRGSAFRAVAQSGLSPKVGSMSLRANLDPQKKPLRSHGVNLSQKFSLIDDDLDAMLDREIQDLTRGLVWDAVGIHAGRCLNPIAKMFLDKDSMHFVPIDVPESPLSMNLTLNGSAFTRYIHRAT